MGQWSLLTNHARALLVIAHDPQARLRDVAEELGITERTAFGIVADLAASGYVIKQKSGRRNTYHVRGNLPVPGASGRDATVSELLGLLVDYETPTKPDAKRRSVPRTRPVGR